MLLKYTILVLGGYVIFWCPFAYYARRGWKTKKNAIQSFLCCAITFLVIAMLNGFSVESIYIFLSFSFGLLLALTTHFFIFKWNVKY